MQSVFQFYSDPGHGWMKVSQKDVQRLGLKASDFSSCSYLGRFCIYLEEDGDMWKFMNAYHDKYGRFPERNTYHTDEESTIRQRPPNTEQFRHRYVPSIA